MKKNVSCRGKLRSLPYYATICGKVLKLFYSNCGKLNIYKRTMFLKIK